jgi:hypothetical protein
LRSASGTLYAILKNNYDDFPMPLVSLHNLATEMKDAYLAC